MEVKRIVFTEPCKAELLDVEIGALEADEVLTKIEVSTISSGTERALISGDPNISYTDFNPKVVFPRHSGYSSAGVVVEVGSAVTSVKPGDRVALSWSSHSNYCKLKESNVHKIVADSISFEEAALCHIVTFPLAAIRKCRLEVGESAIVMGLGILGMFAVKLLRAAGAVPIIAVDPVAHKREEALASGADYALDPFDPNFAKTVKELTDGGAKVGIEVTGIGAGLDGILDCMAHFGRVALLGCTRNANFNIDYYRKVHGPGITLVGAHTVARPKLESSAAYWTTHDDMMAVMRMIAAGRLSIREMIDETLSPTECGAAYTRLVTEKFFPLVQFDWNRLEGAK